VLKHNGAPLHCIAPIERPTNGTALSANTEVAALWKRKVVGEPKMLSYPFPVMWGREVTTACSRTRLKRDGTRAETGFGRSAKRTSPFKLEEASGHSTTGS